MKIFTYSLLSSAVILSLGVSAGIPTVDNTVTETFAQSTFEIADASVWSANGPSSMSVNWALSTQDWDRIFGRAPRHRVGVGHVAEGCILGVCVKAGAAAGLEIETYLLPYVDARLDPGTFDASVSYAPTVTYQTAGLGVDFFNLDTQSGLVGTADDFADITVEVPSFQLEAGLNVSANLNLFAEACLLGCFLDETFNIVSGQFQLPLLEVDTLEGSARVFAPDIANKAPHEIAETVGGLIYTLATDPDSFEGAAMDVLYVDISGLLEKAGDVAWDAYKDKLEEDSKYQNNPNDPENQQKLDRAEEANNKKNAIDVAESILANNNNPMTLDFSNPYTENKEANWSLDSSGQVAANTTFGGELASLMVDMDQVIGYAFGLKNGSEISLSDITGNKNSPIDATISLIDIQAGPVVSLETDITVAPELMVQLDFSEGVLIKGQIGQQTQYTGTWENMPDFALLAPGTGQGVGDSNAFNQIVTADLSFAVDAKVTNHTYIDVKGVGTITGPQAVVSIDGIGELDTGPLFVESFATDSFAKIDIYNNSFNTGSWLDGAPTAPVANALSFDRAGEVVFQARDKYYASNDPGKDDARVEQTITSSYLVNEELNRRGFNNSVVFDDLLNSRGELIWQPSAFEFFDDDVKNAFENQYTIENQQHGQIMTDGVLRIDPNAPFTVQVGGTLEIGAKNHHADPNVIYRESIVNAFGVHNRGDFTVHGDVYMAGGANAVNTDVNYINLINEGTIEVGATGRIKFDGVFVNTQEGVVHNAGSIELTSHINGSSGTFFNHYGGELELFGSFGLDNSQNALINFGDVNIRTGAELSLSPNNLITQPVVTANNFAQIMIEQGAQLALVSMGENKGAAQLNNRHIIDNSGIIDIGAGNQLVNGQSGSDWEAYRDIEDPLAHARGLRDEAMGSLYDTKFTDAYILKYELATDLAATAAIQKQLFIQEAYGTIAYVKEKLGVNGVYSTQVPFDNYQTAVASATNWVVEEAAREVLINILKTGVPHQLKHRNQWNSTAQVDYGNTLRSLTEARGHSKNLLQLVETNFEINANATGLGILVNRQGGIILNQGTLTNHSVILNSTGAGLFNETSASLDNQGYIRNNGLLVNQAGGKLLNSGAIDNGSQTVRDTFGVLDMAQLINFGELNNSGEVRNSDTLVNYGQLTNQSSSRIQNAGIFSNIGALENNGSVVNQAGAEVTNHGSIVNNDNFANWGIFNNGQDPNRGKQIGDNGYVGNTFSVAEILASANQFYQYQQTLYAADNRLLNLAEQIADAKARKGLTIGNDHYSAAAQFKIKDLETQRDALLQERNNAATAMTNLAGVSEKTYKDKDGNLLTTGELFINLASIMSVNSAEFINNGTFDNGGLFNNVATVTNTQSGLIHNTGMLMSNGTIDNHGLVQVDSGMLVNGVAGNSAAVFNNTGSIMLIGDSGAATLVNQGEINNYGGGLIQIGENQNATLGSHLLANTSLFNFAQVTNGAGGTIGNYGVLHNAGFIDNLAGSSFINQGLLNNSAAGTINFAEAADLGGSINNNGLIAIQDGELLSLSGNISGNGTFAGDVLLHGELSDPNEVDNLGHGKYTTTINPGNSPGLLTFDGNVTANNVNWVMEIWGTKRGIDYDAVDINGDFTLFGGMSLSILALVDYNTLISQSFNFFSFTGNLYDAAGNMLVNSFEFVDFSVNMLGNWAGNWMQSASGWDLNLSFIGRNTDMYANLRNSAQTRLRTVAVGVPEPTSVVIMVSGLFILLWRSRRTKLTATNLMR